MADEPTLEQLDQFASELLLGVMEHYRTDFGTKPRERAKKDGYIEHFNFIPPYIAMRNAQKHAELLMVEQAILGRMEAVQKNMETVQAKMEKDGKKLTWLTVALLILTAVLAVGEIGKWCGQTHGKETTATQPTAKP